MSKLVIMIACAMLVLSGLLSAVTQILNTPCSSSKTTKCYMVSKMDGNGVPKEVKDMRIPKIISGVMMLAVGVLLFVTSKKMNKTVMIIASIVLVLTGLSTTITQLSNKPCDYEKSKKMVKYGADLAQGNFDDLLGVGVTVPGAGAVPEIPKSCVMKVKYGSSVKVQKQSMYIPKMISGVMMLVVGVLLFINSRKSNTL